MTVTVVQVTTRREQEIFLQFPWTLYHGDPHWVPPIRSDQRQRCGFAKHPFYERAESQAFLAYRNGQPVGRILAIANHLHNELHQDKIGFFGFFESIDDQQVAKSLLQAARGYLKNRGYQVMRGPVSPSMNYECGALVDGFDSMPVFMMTYNPPYYPSLFEASGLAKAHDLYAYRGTYEMLAQNEKRWNFVSQRLGERVKLNMRPMYRKDFDKELRGFMDVFNQALVGSWGFVPLTEAEMKHIANSLRYLIAPEMTSVIEVDGERVGVSFGMLDYNPRIKSIDGKLFPFGFLKLILNKRTIKRIRLISTNVVPRFQKNKGVGMSLFFNLIPAIREWGIEECEFSWVLESNTFSRATLERCGTELYKTYRIYDVDVDVDG
ncbi:MAG TPA: N-acetyltransferase [Pirellulaceae bacterium]|mgnify:CR=1 FL=1|nr:N-acetyltransferase [Pirellulaceae bacterium]HMO92144.1 N-acetyltransferase [Pirellulaceae bacterium]HMP68931.1 N-acetyltransferase [Pirellulaceae bacterium]